MPSVTSLGCRGAFFAPGGVSLVVITSPDMLLSRAQAAEVAGVSVERIRTWERRKHLDRAGLDENGYPQYRALDVAKCKHRFHGCARDEAA